MAEGPVTPAKAKSQDVELLFQKMGEKLGWFQHKDLDSAMKSLTKSSKKRSTKSRVKHKSDDPDASNKENRSSKGTSKLHSGSDSLSKQGSEYDKGKIKKHKTKSRKPATDDCDTNPPSDKRLPKTDEDYYSGYPLKPSKASTDLIRDNKEMKKTLRVSESPLKESDNVVQTNSRLSNDRCDYSDSFLDMPSMLEDIGAPLVESTRIHSRESISFYKLRDSFMSNGSNDSSVGLDQSSFDNLRICSGEDGVRYFQKDKTLIRVRNSLPANEFKKRQLDTSDKYYSVVGESVIGEERDEYYSVLEESPLGAETEKCNQSPNLKENVCTAKSKSSESTNSPVRENVVHKGGQDFELDLVGKLRNEADVNDLRSKHGNIGAYKPTEGVSTQIDGEVMDKKELNGRSESTKQFSKEADVNNVRSKYREVPEYKSVIEGESDSSGSFYEVEDACAQTEDMDQAESDLEAKSDSETDGEDSWADLAAEQGATVIENKLRVSDLCDRLQGLTHEDEKGSCDESKPAAKAKSCETVGDHRPQNDGEEDLSSDSGKDASLDSVTSDNLTSENSDGSFYDVVDQCVQTEADLSQTEDVNNASTSVQSIQGNSNSKSLSSSTSATPRLAEIQSATYEKLRMSLKKFKTTPTHAGGLMETVLKKVNLFGSNSSLKNPSKNVDELDKNKTGEHEKPDSKLTPVTDVKVKGEVAGLVLAKPTNWKLPIEINKKDLKLHMKKTITDKETKMDNHPGDCVLVENGIKVLSVSGRKNDNECSDINSIPTNQTKWGKLREENDRHVNSEKMKFVEADEYKGRTDVIKTPPKSMPLETLSRRAKLSLKKSRPVNKSSSSSIASSISDNNDLYKTGFSSPDYGCESPPTMQEVKSGLFIGKITSDEDHDKKVKSEPSISIPDSPPTSHINEPNQQAEGEQLFSDEGVAGVPDSASDASCDEFHSVWKDSKRDQGETKSEKKSVENLPDSDQGEIIRSDSSPDEFDEIVRKKKLRHEKGLDKPVKKSVSSKRNVDKLDDSLDDIPDTNDRYCVTVSDTSTWRSSKTVSDSSEEEDLEAFFQKMKKTKKTKKLVSSPEASDTDSMKDFIVDDSDVESESDEDVFYLKTNNTKKDPTPRVPRYITSSDEDSWEEREKSEEESEAEEVIQKKKPQGKVPKKPSAPETPLPKPAPRNYETPKAQITSASTMASSAKSSSCVKIYSFLKSLTADLPSYRRHPDASIYVNQFKKYKGELSQRLFKLYNQTVFDNKLPATLDISWNNRMRKTAGYCKYMKNHMAKVELSDKVCDTAERLRDTLIHELCHAASWVLNHKNDGHGPYWKYWTRKATQSHPELPIISRCHSYDIATKYTYQCVGCGYSIGRHSKSLDTDRKVCGKCHGRFQVRLTKDTPTSSTSSTPRTPRTPNKFALFVKEKYGVFKREKKDLKHKDIMQLLSREFAAKNKLSD